MAVRAAVADAIFAHPRLAPLYDAFDGPRDDMPAYVGIADELGAHRVLDAGCGTGSLAILLAGTGRAVIGADPAAASLEVARSKDASNAVTWVHRRRGGARRRCRSCRGGAGGRCRSCRDDGERGPGLSCR